MGVFGLREIGQPQSHAQIDSHRRERIAEHFIDRRQLVANLREVDELAIGPLHIDRRASRFQTHARRRQSEPCLHPLNVALRRVDRHSPIKLTQAAWAATRANNTYLAAQFRRLTTRLGKRRALVAVGHSILVIAYHLLSKRASYQELGGNYFDRQNVTAYRSKLVRKLEAIGLKVTLEPAAT